MLNRWIFWCNCWCTPTNVAARDLCCVQRNTGRESALLAQFKIAHSLHTDFQIGFSLSYHSVTVQSCSTDDFNFQNLCPEFCGMTSDSKIGKECKNSHRKWRRCHLVRFPNPLAFLKSDGDLVYWRIAVHWCHLATQVLHHYNARVFADSVTLWPMPCTLHWGEVKPGLPHHLLRHLLKHPWCNLHVDTSVLIFQSVARILHRVDCKKDDCDGESLPTTGGPPENILMVTSTQVRLEEN